MRQAQPQAGRQARHQPLEQRQVRQSGAARAGMKRRQAQAAVVPRLPLVPRQWLAPRLWATRPA